MDPVIGTEVRHALDEVVGSRVIELPMHRPEFAADAIVEFAEEMQLDAIVPVDDSGVVTAAIASDRLGLTHNPVASVGLTRDKSAMRRRLAEAEVRQPAFGLAADGADPAMVAAQLGLPVVVKPLRLSGSRGVIRANSKEEVTLAADRIREMLPASKGRIREPLLIEKFAPGVEVAVEGLLRDGDLETLAVFDKPDPLDGPFFEETIYVTPSRLPQHALSAVEDEVRRAAVALGLMHGPMHAEVRVDGDAVSVIEVAARSIGGLCARSLRFGLDLSLESLILRCALGLPIRDVAATHVASGVMMLPIPHAGVLIGVGGREAAGAVAGIKGLEITIPPGRWVDPLPEGDRYLGFLFARGDTPAYVESALREAHAMLDIQIDMYREQDQKKASRETVRGC